MVTPEKQHDREELDWLAFRYIVDELDQVDREAFELQMADCQEAREALARAVQVTQALVALERCRPMPADRPVSHQQRGDRWRRATWIMATVAGCLAVALVVQTVRNFHSEVEPSVATRSSGLAGAARSDQLAFAWIETIDELAVSSSDDDAGADMPEPETPAADEPFEEGFDLAAPDWMLAAVSGLSGKADDGIRKATGNEAAEK